MKAYKDITRLAEPKGDKIVKGVELDLWNRFVGLAKIKGMGVGALMNETLFVLLEKEKIVSKKQNNKGDEK